jgi:hypothetical protein
MFFFMWIGNHKFYIQFSRLLRLQSFRITLYMLFGAKMVLCALAGLSASLRSAANLPAAAHKASFLLLIT